jgi:DNA-binding transcriptional LysR family regulator
LEALGVDLDEQRVGRQASEVQMDLNSLQTFIAVVRAGGFSAAAREIDAPRSSVSAKIRNLEKDLGVRLFKRSTRAFSLTAEGQTLYLQSADAMTSLINAVNTVTHGGESFSGEIRITLPADFPPQIIATAIAEYRQANPAVRFQILNTNDVLDLISNNIDVALRIGASNPQNAIVRGVVEMKIGLFASRHYLEVNGAPRHVNEIASFIGPQRADLRRLILSSLPKATQLPVLDIVADSFTFVRELMLLDQGVGLLPAYLCRADIAAGTVVPVLEDQFAGTVRMYLTHPSRADLSPKVTSFARLLARHLEAAPHRPVLSSAG